MYYTEREREFLRLGAFIVAASPPRFFVVYVVAASSSFFPHPVDRSTRLHTHTHTQTRARTAAVTKNILNLRLYLSLRLVSPLVHFVTLSSINNNNNGLHRLRLQRNASWHRKGKLNKTHLPFLHSFLFF